tara:strand:- start:1676 stop:2131 length:456 start_codon:yes stop_codon:yes gene_type:complete
MALSTFDSRKDNAAFDKLVHTGDHENPLSKMLTEIASKLDELVNKINSIDTATNTNTAKTGITTGQASAITANTAKVSMTLGTSGSTALAGDTKIVGYVGSSDTNITIGNMASAVVKGQTVYTLPITVTQTGTDKLGNPTTLTKTATLTLT